MRRATLLVLAAVLPCTAIGFQWFAASARRDPVRQLARMKLERPFAPRLSIPFEYHACTPGPANPADPARRVPRETCGESDKGSLNLLALKRAGESIDPDSLLASARAGLIWWDDETSLDDAVTHLETARRVSGSRVSVLVDLSAAYLLRAERTDNPLDLFKGLDAAYQALAREPRNAAARFNAALALQKMGFVEQAVLEWAAFLTLEPASPWANEARERQRRLMVRPAAIETPGLAAPASAVTAFAHRHPAQARELGMDRVLGEWGAAVERGNEAGADSLLGFAGVLGRALVEREKSDSSLADAVAAIRGARSDAARAALARAHQMYAAGRAAVEEGRGGEARETFAGVIAARPASPALLQWSMVYHAASPFYQGRTAIAEKELRAQLRRVNGARYPALEGHGRMMLGSVLGRRAKLSENREQLRLAIACLSRAGEDAGVTKALMRDAEPAYELGDAEGAYRSMHRGLQVLLQNPRAADLHNRLVALGGWAERDEMPYAAWAIYNQTAAIVGGPRRPIQIVELHLARSRARRAAGDSLGAAQDLNYAAAWLPHLAADSAQTEFAVSYLRLVRPEGVTAAELDAAVDAFGQNVVWLAPALARRAELNLAQRNVAGAIADLTTLTEGVRRLTRQEETLVFRGAIVEQARNVFDRLVAVQLANGDVRGALRALERGRMSFAARRARQPRPGEGRLVAPPGHVAVEYAFIGDTLLTWTVDTDSIHVWKQPLDRETFLLTVQQAGVALESARAPIPKGALRRLYDWLIRPIANRLGGPGTPLIVLADGEVAGVPFAALMDQDRYLIQDHSLRFAATLEDAAQPVPRGSGPVLLVADPAFDRIQNSALDPLPGALAEVQSLAAIYPQKKVVLEDTSATREAFIEQAQRAGLIHYAGHAVFNDVRPERSYLLLAGRDTTGRLTAEAVSTLSLGNVRLVVLSACTTVRSRSGRSGGFAGLSGALLAAGAGGVVGSLWQVNDELAGPLMRAFHQEYSNHPGDPARALQAAQLQMLRSRHSPAAWAGFRYMGS